MSWLAQKVERLGHFAAGRQNLGMNLDGGAQRHGQPGIGVQLASAQQVERELAGLGGIGVGAVVVPGVQGAARQPGKRGRELGRGAGLA